VLAINTLGVLYVVSKDNQISSLSDLNGKTIYVPSQNPTFITKHIIDSNGIDATIDSTTYSTPAALQAAVVAGQVDIAVLPQPVVTAAIAGAKKANFNYAISLDLTEEWDKIPNSEKLVQGCIVVRKGFAEKNRGAVNAFLDEYEASINYLNENPTEAAALIAKHGIFANAAVAEKAIPNCNVAFMKGQEMKEAMSAFISVMFEIAPKSIGDKLPLDDFYLVNP
jgi:NitT/TauT family transport system substrate-binding protein